MNLNQEYTDEEKKIIEEAREYLKKFVEEDSGSYDYYLEKTIKDIAKSRGVEFNFHRENISID